MGQKGKGLRYILLFWSTLAEHPGNVVVSGETFNVGVEIPWSNGGGTVSSHTGSQIFFLGWNKTVTESILLYI